jgi:hypothetical protein
MKSKHKIDKLMVEIKKFSNKTFGTPQVRNERGALEHLKLEVIELLDNTDDKHEWADCMLLLLDAARRKGITVNKLIDYCFEKIEINKTRTWEKAKNGIYLHKK